MSTRGPRSVEMVDCDDEMTDVESVSNNALQIECLGTYNQMAMAARLISMPMRLKGSRRDRRPFQNPALALALAIGIGTLRSGQDTRMKRDRDPFRETNAIRASPNQQAACARLLNPYACPSIEASSFEFLPELRANGVPVFPC